MKPSEFIIKNYKPNKIHDFSFESIEDMNIFMNLLLSELDKISLQTDYLEKQINKLFYLREENINKAYSERKKTESGGTISTCKSHGLDFQES